MVVLRAPQEADNVVATANHVDAVRSAIEMRNMRLGGRPRWELEDRMPFPGERTVVASAAGDSDVVLTQAAGGGRLAALSVLVSASGHIRRLRPAAHSTSQLAAMQGNTLLAAMEGATGVAPAAVRARGAAATPAERDALLAAASLLAGGDHYAGLKQLGGSRAAALLLSLLAAVRWAASPLSLCHGVMGAMAAAVASLGALQAAEGDAAPQWASDATLQPALLAGTIVLASRAAAAYLRPAVVQLVAGVLTLCNVGGPAGGGEMAAACIAGKQPPPTTPVQLQRALKLAVVSLTLDKAIEALSLQRIKEEAWASERARRWRRGVGRVVVRGDGGTGEGQHAQPLAAPPPTHHPAPD